MNAMLAQKYTMPTNLHGRLRNTPLPITSGLLPLFEAVVNSIHAIDEAGVSPADGKILIKIIREQKKQQRLSLSDPRKRGPEALDDIAAFEIEDNGIGFTDENMTSFRTLDSEHKIDRGCRGVGRLLWLKAFREVRVDSKYRAGPSVRRRTFSFTANDGIANEIDAISHDDTVKTSIILDQFDARYRSYARKTPKSIADSIFEHCLWYFLRQGGAPLIEVIDESERISLNDVFDAHMHSSAVREAITIKDQPFDLIHVRLRSNALSAHAIAFCADNRLVKEERLSGKVPGLHGRLADADGEFIYSCYVSSDFLDACVRPERTDFAISDSVEGLLVDTEIGLNDIREAVVERAKTHLSEHLEENLKQAKEKVVKFVSTKAPRYRSILPRIPDSELNIDPEISDRDLELALHKQLAGIERELIAEGHDVLYKLPSTPDDEYRGKLRSYLAKAEDLKMSDLASYVSHRRVIIDLFEKAIERDSDGNYVREDLIHNLIMPMRTGSDEISLDSCNLWLVDERLAFHDYLASDKPLSAMPITGSRDGKKPDLCALKVFDQPILVSEETKPPLATIEILEIKRPMRPDASAGEESDPIEQAVGYLRRIREGKVCTASGRPIPRSDSIPGFCYVLADLTPQFEQRCRDHHDLKRTHDGLGYFGYKSNANAYIEVISFDRLVSAAKERNRAFFERLGLPAN